MKAEQGSMILKSSFSPVVPASDYTCLWVDERKVRNCYIQYRDYQCRLYTARLYCMQLYGRLVLCIDLFKTILWRKIPQYVAWIRKRILLCTVIIDPNRPIGQSRAGVVCLYLDHVGGGSSQFLRHEEALNIEGELTLIGCPRRQLEG